MHGVHISQIRYLLVGLVLGHTCAHVDLVVAWLCSYPLEYHCAVWQEEHLLDRYCQLSLDKLCRLGAGERWTEFQTAACLDVSSGGAPLIWPAQRRCGCVHPHPQCIGKWLSHTLSPMQGHRRGLWLQCAIEPLHTLVHCLQGESLGHKKGWVVAPPGGAQCSFLNHHPVSSSGHHCVRRPWPPSCVGFWDLVGQSGYTSWAFLCRTERYISLQVLRVHNRGTQHHSTMTSRTFGTAICVSVIYIFSERGHEG